MYQHSNSVMCVWHCFCRKSKITKLESLKWHPFSIVSFIFLYFSFQKFNCLRQDVSYIAVKFILSAFMQNIAKYWTRFASELFVLSQIMFVGPPLKIRVSLSSENIYIVSCWCENKLLMSNSARTSFYTLTLKRSAARLRLEGDFK